MDKIPDDLLDRALRAYDDGAGHDLLRTLEAVVRLAYERGMSDARRVQPGPCTQSAPGLTDGTMEVTDEMVRAFMRAYAEADDGSAKVILEDAAEKAGLAAVLAIAERDMVRPGPCTQSAPGLWEGVPPVTCTLLAGHAGGHTNGVTSWTSAEDADLEPVRPGDVAPMRDGECDPDGCSCK